MKAGRKLVLRHVGLLLVIFCFYGAYFSPIILSGRLLASGDGISYYLPNFYAGVTLWDPLIASGFPTVADPQAMTWYPLSVALFWLARSWNLFVMLAYVLATYGMFRYVQFVTGSWLGGIAAGFAFGLSGFLSARMDHTSILHSASWLPLILLALEKVRVDGSIGWFTVGTFGLCCCALAGHPQIFVYTVMLCGGCALFTGVGRSTCMVRWKFYGVCAAMLLLSAGLAAVLVVPALELGELSPRRELTFEEFASFALPVEQLAGLLFPFLFGGSSASIYGQDYFGRWNHGELVGFCGLTTLALAAVGLFRSDKHLLKWFFLLAAVGGLLLALGDATPLARITYHLPGLNKFRAPARHLLEYTFAVSVLAGLGVAAVERHDRSPRMTVPPLLACAALITTALVATYLRSDRLAAMALEKGLPSASFVPWSNPALGIPIVIFLGAAAAVLFWSAQPSSRLRCTLLIAVLVADAGSYAWHGSVLHFPAAAGDIVAAPAFADEYRQRLAADWQRILPVRGWGVLTDIPPNLSKLWNVPSAGLYGPLVISRVSELLGMASTGHIYGCWFDSQNQALDLMAVKYVFDSTPAQNVVSIGTEQDRWAPEDSNLKLGGACGNHVLQREASFRVEPAFEATGIGLVSHLICSTEVPNGEDVVDITVKDRAGGILKQTVRAGRDSSEWAYGCPAVCTPIRHEQAAIFDGLPAASCEGHRYVAFLPFDGARQVAEIKLQWTGSSGAIIVDKLSLLNEAHRQACQLTPLASSLAAAARWRQDGEESATRIYRNLRAMPRAWLVPEAVSAAPGDILAAIHTSSLPDGRPFDCSRTALVEEPLVFKVDRFDEQAKAKILGLTDTRVKIRTSAKSPSFLVLSDVNYPGWRVAIDGQRAHLYQTDYVLRGVMVPAGEHEVTFEFRPVMFYTGLAISAVSAVFILFIVVFRRIVAGRLRLPHR